MYAKFVRHISFPFYEWWHDSTFLKDMKVFERTQWFSPEQLREIQWKKLQNILQHAYKDVPYYTEVFRHLGAAPEDIRSFDDFSKFPVLTKATLRERLQELVATDIPRLGLIRGITSGSSGIPTSYYHDVAGDRIRKAAGRRLSRIAGYDLGLRQFLFWRESPYVYDDDDRVKGEGDVSPPKSLLGRMKKSLHDRFGVENVTVRVDPSLLNEKDMEDLYHLLRKFRPEVIVAYVNALYYFARFLDQYGHKDIRPSSIIVSSEMLHPHQRNLMERVFGCPVYNRYGLQETGIVAVECYQRQGLHLNQEILYMEFLPFLEGKSKLVVTDLVNRSMPLLRYETGDTGTSIEGPCPCGRGLTRIGNIEGRIIELLPTKKGGFVNGQVFATFHWIPGVKQYQVVQKQLDQFEIKIVKTDGFDDKNLKPVFETIRQDFGEESLIRVEYVEKIPFTQGGKYQLVVSDLQKE